MLAAFHQLIVNHWADRVQWISVLVQIPVSTLAVLGQSSTGKGFYPGTGAVDALPEEINDQISCLNSVRLLSYIS